MCPRGTCSTGITRRRRSCRGTALLPCALPGSVRTSESCTRPAEWQAGFSANCRCRPAGLVAGDLDGSVEGGVAEVRDVRDQPDPREVDEASEHLDEGVCAGAVEELGFVDHEEAALASPAVSRGGGRGRSWSARLTVVRSPPENVS